MVIYALILFGITTLFIYFGTFKALGTNQINLLEPKVNNFYQIKPITTIKYGFLPYWSIETFNTNELNNLTDLTYFSLFLNSNGTVDKSSNHYQMWENSDKLYYINQKAKEQGVRLNLTVSIHDNQTIETFLTCGQPCWKTSLTQVEDQISSSGYKGINFDFENVGNTPDTLSKLYAEYVVFMSNNLKQKYGNSFLIVVSTYGDSVVKNRITKISYLNTPEINYLFVMAYDFFRPNNDVAGPTAPLTGANSKYHYDITKMTEDYLTQITADKIILGIPLYGLNFIVEKPEPYAKRVLGNDVIQYSIQQNLGAINFLRKRENAEVKWDQVSNTPYFTYYKTVEGVHRIVFFENEKSIKLKQEFAINKGFSGVGYWALGY